MTPLVWEDKIPLLPVGWTLATLGQKDNGQWWCEAREGYLTSYTNVVVCDDHYDRPIQAINAVIYKINIILDIREKARKAGLPVGKYYL